jgi:ribosomal protein S6--L-glutamate ligase
MTRSTARVAVIGVPGAWSTETLADALERRTGFRRVVEMRELAADLDRGTVTFRGDDLATLDGIVVKKIASAYTPDALERIELLRFLESRGVRVFSRPDAMMPLIDRLMGTVRLRVGGIPMPPTYVTEDLDLAVARVRAVGRTIGKPLYTSKARGMVVFEDGPDLRERLAAFQAAGNPQIYLQNMVEIPGRDLGITFLGGRYLATYARAAQGAWTAAVAEGSRYTEARPDPAVIELAHRAQGLFDLDFTCVDVVESGEGPLVFEVSAFGGFRGLQDACGLDAAALYADHVLEKLS